MRKSNPPFRADHVGSLLRPPELLEARSQHQRGEIQADALRKVEDQAIERAIRKQEEIGLKSITDGEFRRTFFHTDFLEKLDGVSISGGIGVKFHTHEGIIEFAPPRLAVTGKLRHSQDIQRADFEYLQSITRQTPKVTIPSPTMTHFRGGRQAIDIEAYPDLDEFFADLAQVYREEIASLYQAGCRYIQMDDTNLAYLCDPELREGARLRGDDPNELPQTYSQLINAVVDDRPDDLTIAVHMCRGNFQSAWVAEGGYEPVAEILFNNMNIDAFFLEYDDERSGDFKPLRFVPADKTIVLGLVTTKEGKLESSDELKQRVEEAGQFMPLENMSLSPQCGFSSTVHGNQISHEDQWRKLELVVNTARDIWGD